MANPTAITGNGMATLRGMMLDTADRLAGAVGVLGRPFRVERMLEQARRRTGLDDFGDRASSSRCGACSTVAWAKPTSA